ncbi:BirA family biotin operon repressor/biotin-[acetyl-CoA-carboxylase] ligase [Pseudomonas sp. SORGH_AS 211]|uniref:bifunctional biotin--[acetyl-CoA-carboxylase] ligase/biotin operon repressor BirA n=1 Tax=Pseudomonas sp. SORGH_AS_0211 TaxID=3041796 RepID=UPI002856FFCC|nr:bifunctional biotin--[acetyl-CoA-carboxylase] ligase/biotin operon repressor BirA [Pseudomonas sp. SORGH_AS_0211]MDR6177149.1 BirA family biotin operon repressor/biotin-[acetyl-CoA-carboxylase] ligase [Pseudomonas sp. SORGH_AS_0211]
MPLLKLLSDGKFHSGVELGEALGVSRSAIWKRLKTLEDDLGVEVFKVPGRGYRLEEPLSLLDAERIAREGGWPVTVLASIDSTNAEAQRRLHQQLPPFALLAEHQQAGRGRRGRAWVSPYGKNLYLTAVVSSQGGIQKLQALSLTMGLAVIRTLQQLGVEDACLKWPNDVLVRGRKLAGILIELSGDPQDVCQAIIGIGINVNMRLADNIDQPWISMAEALGGLQDRNQVASLLLREIDNLWQIHRQVGFAALRGEWERYHGWQGRAVTLSSGVRCIQGTVAGVAEDGAILMHVDGRTQAFSGGELSLSLDHDS